MSKETRGRQEGSPFPPPNNNIHPHSARMKAAYAAKTERCELLGLWLREWKREGLLPGMAGRKEGGPHCLLSVAAPGIIHTCCSGVTSTSQVQARDGKTGGPRLFELALPARGSQNARSTKLWPYKWLYSTVHISLWDVAWIPPPGSLWRLMWVSGNLKFAPASYRSEIHAAKNVGRVVGQLIFGQ